MERHASGTHSPRMRPNRSPLIPMLQPREPAQPLRGAEPRASLAGLEVSETAIHDWLAAGGERRKTPRPPQAADPAKAGS